MMPDQSGREGRHAASTEALPTAATLDHEATTHANGSNVRQNS
jgi:hypothetical protein